MFLTLTNTASLRLLESFSAPSPAVVGIRGVPSRLTTGIRIVCSPFVVNVADIRPSLLMFRSLRRCTLSTCPSKTLASEACRTSRPGTSETFQRVSYPAASVFPQEDRLVSAYVVCTSPHKPPALAVGSLTCPLLVFPAHHLFMRMYPILGYKARNFCRWVRNILDFVIFLPYISGKHEQHLRLSSKSTRRQL